jgi:hypothetical protein
MPWDHVKPERVVTRKTAEYLSTIWRVYVYVLTHKTVTTSIRSLHNTYVTVDMYVCLSVSYQQAVHIIHKIKLLNSIYNTWFC